MAKDRARPFSRKHRKYWLTVTGGMLLIGGINVAIGVCAYQKAPDQHQRIEPVLPEPTKPAGMSLGQLPAAVMQAFTKAYPQHVPQSARPVGDAFELTFVDGGATRTVTFRADGTPATSN